MFLFNPEESSMLIGAAYLNDLTANILCLIFGISSIGPLVFECMLSYAEFQMVMSFWRYLGATLLMHLNVSSTIL